MNFTSFEACEPEGSGISCVSNSTDWVRAWEVGKNTELLWRLNVTNNGLIHILLDEKTSLIGLPVKAGGGGDAPTPFFIRADSTPTNENAGAYDPNYSKKLLIGQSTMLYFGSKTTGGGALEKTDSNPGIVSVMVVIFGYEDVNSNLQYDQGTDTPYSQSIPFQAYSVI